MQYYYQGIENHLGEWCGYEVMVQTKSNKPPKLHLQLAKGGFFKLLYGEKRLFWAKQHCHYYGVAILKTFASMNMLEPITSNEVEVRKGLESEAFLESWSRYFLNVFRHKPEELFYNGTWLLVPYRYEAKFSAYAPLNGFRQTRYIYDVENSLSPLSFQQLDWFGGVEHLVSLKKVDPYSGRLKWWRKKAKERSLPPVMLLHISGLDNYLILDGHYRLKAAELEGVKVDLLVFFATQKREITWDNSKRKESILKQIEANDFSVTQQNRLVQEAYHNATTEYNLSSRVFGFSQQDEIKEVIAYLHQLDKLSFMQDFFHGEWEELEEIEEE